MSTFGAMREPRRFLKVFLPLGFSLLGLATLKLLDPHLVSRAQLLQWLRPLGPWTPVAYVGLLFIRPVTLLPGQLLTAVGGILFGGWQGTALSVIGSALGSTLTYGISRLLGPRLIRYSLGPERAAALARAARQNDFLFALLFTINPLVPTDPCIAAAASAGGRYGRVLAGTLLGTLPGTLATAYFGSALSAGRPWLAALTALACVVSVAGGAWLGWRTYRTVLSEVASPRPSRPQGASVRPAAFLHSGLGAESETAS